jgi:hypothetical protein
MVLAHRHSLTLVAVCVSVPGNPICPRRFLAELYLIAYIR